MKTHHTIIIGDSRLMSEVHDQSVHLIITSPPYWQLKDYGHEDQIGFNHSYEEYINHLNLVWSECYRVLMDGCRLCINIGDQFARSVYYGRYKVIPIREEIIKFCETIGFDYMGAIIWQKPTTMNTSGGASIMGSFPYPRNGIIKIDYEFILIFKKPGSPPKVSKEIKEISKLSKEEWNEYFNGHWYFNGERQNEHIAMFPEELPKRLIKMFSFVGDTILDPFLGSGTTSLAAVNLHRNSIGYEINSSFLPIIKKKLAIEEKRAIADFIFIETEKQNIDWDKHMSRLPYIFVDKTRFDKKVDPRKLSFGSRVSSEEKKSTTTYYTIKEILSPTTLLLNNGVKVRLIGIKTNPQKEQAAIDFLKQKTSGQRIFLKFDINKYDEEGNLLVYLYLKNKTFINLHLIKYGFVEVDRGSEYSLKERFLQTEEMICQKSGY